MGFLGAGPVMAGLVPAIHASLVDSMTWMPGTMPGMTLGTTPRLKLHARRLVERRALLAEIEEGLGVEAEHAGEQGGRELLDAGIVFLHRIVEEAARGGELVLDVRQVHLQLLEVLVGLEVGVRFRHREQLPQRAG